MSRNTKTPAQRAQEALELAGRHVERLTTKWERLTDEAETVEAELTAAKVRRDYLAQHPDLDVIDALHADDATEAGDDRG